MRQPFSVYLAGPEVFLVNARQILQAKKAICQQQGWVGLAPVDNEDLDPSLTEQALANAIYQGNLDQMNRADAIIANITPFRGPHMDPGTAFEVGFFAAQHKPIVVYTQDPHELADRVMAWSGQPVDGEDHRGQLLRDRNQHLVENFGFRENLMIEAAARQAVHAGVVVAPAPREQMFQCCLGFQEAVRSLAERMARQTP